MQPGLLHYKNSVIAWYRFGNGPRAVACFHGYGEGATSFAFLGKAAGDTHSFYAIELPFHGGTQWNEPGDFTPGDLAAIVEQVIPGGNFQVLGYSLGGRVGLCLYQHSPARVTKLVLLAPDGLKVNFWYWVATQTGPGNGLFRLTMKHPGWFFGFLKVFNKLGVVNASIFKFVKYYIADEEVRAILYKRWTSLRQISPSLSRIKDQVRRQHLPVRLVYGEHDRIILSTVGEKFRKGIEEDCSIAVINAGHKVLHENHANAILDALNR